MVVGYGLFWLEGMQTCHQNLSLVSSFIVYECTLCQHSLMFVMFGIAQECWCRLLDCTMCSYHQLKVYS